MRWGRVGVSGLHAPVRNTSAPRGRRCRHASGRHLGPDRNDLVALAAVLVPIGLMVLAIIAFALWLRVSS